MATNLYNLGDSNEIYDEVSWPDSYRILIEDSQAMSNRTAVTGSAVMVGPDGQELSYVSDWQTWEKDNEDPDNNEVVSLERFIYADQ